MTDVASIVAVLPGDPLPTSRLVNLLLARIPQWQTEVNSCATRVGVQARHSVLPTSQLLDPRRQPFDPRFEALTIELATNAARQAMAEAGVVPSQLGAAVAVSSTGFMIPSLDFHLVEELGLDRECLRLAINQTGCHAGLAALRMSQDYFCNSGKSTLIVCIELPSLHMPTGELCREHLGNLLSFGDAAVAAVVSPSRRAAGLRIERAKADLLPCPGSESAARMTIGGIHPVESMGALRVIRRDLRAAVERFLDGAGYSIRDISFWIAPARSPEASEAIQASLELTDQQMEPSRAARRMYGNALSANPFLILRDSAVSAVPHGVLAMALSLGPGIACEMALLSA